MRPTIRRDLFTALLSAAVLFGGTSRGLAADPADTQSPQVYDLGKDVSDYRRFVIYPHLQKALEALQKGDRERTFLELERARALAPDNAAIALHLAQAYRRFGLPAHAESVLRDQLKRTPNDPRVQAALAGDPVSPAGRPASSPAASERVPPSRPAEPDRVAAVTPPTATTSAPNRVTSAPRRRLAPIPQPPSENTATSEPAAAPDPMAPFTRALEQKRFDEAVNEAKQLLAQQASNASILDVLTYQMAEAGGRGDAARLLLAAYPFSSAAPDIRGALLNRLVLLVQQPGVIPDDELGRLRVPLDSPSLRSQQAVLWAGRNDCTTVRAILADSSPDYGYEDWTRLGDCLSSNAPALAVQAYSRAHALQPGSAGSRALAYQAHAVADYATALTAWRSMSDRLAGDDLLAAATTAVEAGDLARAGEWTGRYREQGRSLNHRYWALTARIALARNDTAAARIALEQSIATQPEIDDYLQLALLQTDPQEQVQWLQKAQTAFPGQPAIEAELGFAYRRTGQNDAALRELERAALLDAANVNVQLALGYMYWESGRFTSAATAFQHAWDADPGNVAAAEQLVYGYQRLRNNDKARWYAERVLDATASGTPSGSSEQARDLANRRFGLMRLHEDLGRRLTVSLDGWTGSSVGTGTSGSQAGSRYSSYSQLEAEYRLGRQAVRDGTTFAAYTRLLADGGVDRSAWPSQNRVLGVGARWKPWRSQVLYLAAEGQTGLEGEHQRELLLRSSASLFNGGRFSDDWHASDGGWFSRNLYLDAAHYVRSEQSAATADFRNGYHVKIAGRQTIEPYGHVQVSALRTAGVARDVRFGIGSRWNVWHGAARYDAPPHKFSLGLEFQHALDTYLPDRNGLFLALGSRW